MTATSGIPKHKLSRAATLAKSGVQVGGNYAKHYVRKVAGRPDRSALHDDNARTVYKAFSTLRGGPLKVAQMLSIDEHILPSAYREQFQQAQYSAPALSYPLVLRMFKRSLGCAPDALFDSFTRDAVNAASIGQVHQAEKNGKKLAVKIQYPGVAKSLSSDLSLLKPVAGRLLQISPIVLEKYMSEAEARLLEECDYALELARSQELSEQSAHLPNMRFPNYYADWSGSHVITMDWMEGLPLDRWLAEKPSQEARDRIGQALWDFYHHQIHILKVFHADPHPGNFMVNENELVVIDFGCVKVMDPEFYQAYFSLLRPGLLEDQKAFAERLHGLELLLDGDSPAERALIMEAIAESVRLLGQPFLQPSFDFGDPAYLASVYEMGDRNRKDSRFNHIDRSRGPAESLYVNRTFFGLYSLLGQIGAQINTGNLPALFQE